jgi:aminopeptidase-like protein
MSLLRQLESLDSKRIGVEQHDFVRELYPICRSITGEGIRKTLELIRNRIPLRIHEVPSGTKVFDWVVPQEWNIRDAYIKTLSGDRLVDFRGCNLHVMSYSTPVRGIMTLEELKPHLFTIPEKPDWIPYRTSYYKPAWGFCLSHKQMLSLEDREYEVCIDSDLKDGHLTYGEFYVAGKSEEEVLISCHACHPSLANDNLSGLTIAAYLAKFLSTMELHYSYRFLFIPGTIGAITWLSQNRDSAFKIQHGLVLTCMADAGSFHYKQSRRGNADIDRAAAHVLAHHDKGAKILPFSPYGYDERQYCSPGFNLPVGCLMRSVWGTFPEYHTSADNLEFIRAEQLGDSLHVCVKILDILESNRRYENQTPFCEPQLGKRNLFRSIGGSSIDAQSHARLWVLNLSDGSHSLLDIAERSGMPFALLSEAAESLTEAGLLKVLSNSDRTSESVNTSTRSPHS